MVVLALPKLGAYYWVYQVPLADFEGSLGVTLPDGTATKMWDQTDQTHDSCLDLWSDVQGGVGFLNGQADWLLQMGSILVHTFRIPPLFSNMAEGTSPHFARWLSHWNAQKMEHFPATFDYRSSNWMVSWSGVEHVYTWLDGWNKKTSDKRGPNLVSAGFWKGGTCSYRTFCSENADPENDSFDREYLGKWRLTTGFWDYFQTNPLLKRGHFRPPFIRSFSPALDDFFASLRTAAELKNASCCGLGGRGTSWTFTGYGRGCYGYGWKSSYPGEQQSWDVWTFTPQINYGIQITLYCN